LPFKQGIPPLPEANKPGEAPREDAAGPLCIERLKDRADFLRVAEGGRVHGRGFSLQFSKREDGAQARLGFTVTKRVGNAVMRNRVRRRLKEAARLSFPEAAKAGTDYVLVGRIEAASLPFPSLIADLKQALARASHIKAKRGPRKPEQAKP